ncbi:T9SS type B sorting domain-containing protein, partial [Spirosoma harenae]
STVSNGAIWKHIDSLHVGASEQIVFTARLTVKNQEVVNTAQIVYLDNKDTNLANNTSSVTVKDTSAHTASRIGIAKSVLGQPTAEGDSIVKVSYRFVVTNMGDDTLRKVQVSDDLAYAFRPNTVTAANVTLSNSGSTLYLNPAFTGNGANTNLLDSTSYLAPGQSQMMVMNVTVKRTAGDTTKAFDNIAQAFAFNGLATVSDLSTNGGDVDPDNDGDPTNNTGVTSFTLGATQPQGPSIGLALAVVKVEQQPDSSYNVTYKATIKNFGDVELKGISLIDSLNQVFVSPASYSVVGAPTTALGSTLVANASFDGNTQPDILTNASVLGVGVQDTVVFVVNVKTNGNNGPFYSSATVKGTTPDASQTVMDISNSGLDPAPQGSVSTTVRFDLPKGLLGVAKSVGTPIKVQDGVYDVPYTITLTNAGSVPLKNVQLEDNLSAAFGNGALIVSNRIAVASTGTVSVDSLYSGQGMITKMLIDSASTLAVGAKASLSFTVRVDVTSVNPDSLTFFNVAKGSALTPTDDLVEDQSTAGTNADPDNDLDPRNNSQPTPIALNSLASNSYIGLAMAVVDTARQSDGSYNVTYQLVVKAYGPDPLKNVTITDSLSKVFNAQTGALLKVVGAPTITSTGSALKVNPNFNGVSDPVIVLGDSTSQLAAGKVDTIRIVINVLTDGTTTTYLNSAYAQANSPTGVVSDVSTSGLNPDLNGNGNPTDANEREATPLTILPVYTTVFIPEGFSPNGDGINDLFVIRGANGLTVSLEVYNRWGNLVYKNEDYRNDWDGKANTGITISSADAVGVPDGTYYYVVTLSDGRKFVRYMTINR